MSSVSECSEADDAISDLPLSPSKLRKDRPLTRKGSVSDNFFVVKGANLILPKQTSISISNVQTLKKYGGELQVHLKAMFEMLRKEDKIKLAVRLESMHEKHRRYLVVVKTDGRQDTEENMIIGCDFDSPNSKQCTIGMVIPIWCTTHISLDGDGGFKVIVPNKSNHTFKPVSVQAMWCALQCLHRCLDNAQRYNYFEGSLYLTWEGYYRSHIKSDHRYITEWEHNEELWSSRIDYLGHGRDPELEALQSKLGVALKEVMASLDLDECTSRQIRLSVEQKLGMSLNNHKKLVDQEMFRVLGQLETASQILDYLYLGSEWNAMHLDGLKELGITHILNVTLEIDNFYPQDFHYKNIRLFDLPSSDLRSHWESTCKFIDESRANGGKCLVHCKMGISRSASTVAAFLIKDHGMSKAVALEFIKQRRPIADPNEGFLQQLTEWEGIVNASANRHSNLFRARSENDLAVEQQQQQSGMMTSKSPTHHLHGDVIITTSHDEDFDLNRRLLDLGHFTIGSVARAKSWSPDDHNKNQEKMNDYISITSSNDTTQHRGASDPGGHHQTTFMFLSTTSPTTKQQANQHINNRQRHKRHRDKQYDNDVIADSIDSIAVHVGVAPDSNGQMSPTLVIACDDDVTEGSRDGHDDVSSSDVVVEDERPIVVRDMVAEIESAPTAPSAAKRGHHKTLSLPPPQPQGDAVAADAADHHHQQQHHRDRSYSEVITTSTSPVAPSCVRKLVTAIERGKYSPPTTAGEDRPRSQSDAHQYNMNSNNSNNNNQALLPVVKEADDDVFGGGHGDDDVIEERRKQPKLMSQELLFAIRQVGIQLMSDDDHQTGVTSSSAHEEMTSPRRIVREMARKIESQMQTPAAAAQQQQEEKVKRIVAVYDRKEKKKQARKKLTVQRSSSARKGAGCAVVVRGKVDNIEQRKRMLLHRSFSSPQLQKQKS